MIEEVELIERIKKTGAMRRWYQDVPYGKIRPSEHSKFHFADNKTDERSYGDGLWQNYVMPVLQQVSITLDTQNSTICDVGCNAGLFLLRAWESFGFCRLIGVEAAQAGYQQLLITRDYYDKMPLLTYNCCVGEMEKNIKNSITKKIDMATFPMSDLTILSLVHYHLNENDWLKYLKDLTSKSTYLLVITDEDVHDTMPADSKLLERHAKSRGWAVKYSKYSFDKQLMNRQGRHCRNLTSILFQNDRLRRLSVDECFSHQVESYEFNRVFYTQVFPKFIGQVIDGTITEHNYKNTDVYKWQKDGSHGSTAWGPKIASERTISYINIVRTMKEHGQEQPIDINPEGMVDKWDGHHRIAVLKFLKHKYVFGRRI